jgi:hypothetical protein
MLANGATLSYKEKSATDKSYTNLPGLKELPDMGADPEKVDNTCLSDSVKQYENGIGDVGDMKYKFKYDNTSTDSPYRVMRKYAENGTVLSFQEKTKDGTTTEFDAQVSVKRTGGGVNGVIEFELTMSLQSGFTWTDPVNG